MKKSMFATFLVGSILANAAIVQSASIGGPRACAVRAGAPSPSDLASLRAQDSSALRAMRAGDVRSSAALDPAQRAGLERAASSATSLAKMRGGELTSSDVGTIVVIAAVIIVVALIL